MEDQTQSQESAGAEPTVDSTASTEATETRADAGTVTQAVAEPEVVQAAEPETEHETEAADPVLEPSPLQKTEDAIIEAAHAVEHAVESGIERVADFLHLGQHGHAAAQASNPSHQNPFDQEDGNEHF